MPHTLRTLVTPLVFALCLVSTLLACGGPGPAPGATGGGAASEPATGGGSGSSPAQPSCRDDFTINEWVYTGSLAWGACDANPPKNCGGGRYLVFKDGTCVCSSPCSTLGTSCDSGGVTTCRSVQASNGNFAAKTCVANDVPLCERQSQPSNPGTGGGGGNTPSCTATGRSCTFGSECCSGWCSGDNRCD